MTEPVKTATQATQLSEFSRFCSPNPLDESTWDRFVETDEARGGHDVLRLIQQFKDRSASPDPVLAVFSGHTGSGKSTELARVKKALENEYLVVAANIADRYSLPSIDYRQLLFYCADRLIDVADQVKAAIGGTEEKQLLSWFDNKEITEVEKEGREIKTEGGAGIDLLKSLFLKFSGKLYSGGETKEKVSKHIEERLDGLRLNMQIIVEAINKKITPKRLLLVLEGLDKIEDRDQGRKIFFEHRRQLIDIPCSIIFTFPIALWYDQEAGMQNFPVRYVLPMIPVSDPPNGKTGKAGRGRKILADIVYRRIDKSPGLIAPEALDCMIEKSGGLIRDLLYLLRESALGAQIGGRGKIEFHDAEDAVKRLRAEYANRISPSSRLAMEDVENTLARPWPTSAPQQTEAFKALLQNLCILEYNGERWFDLHPLVREHLETQNVPGKKSKTKTRPKKAKAGARSKKR
ncbi:MAG: ATP-binding protein [Nitrospinae bacterium]|nr:ATP-binding protein [Nitrospinota bacterium]